MVFELKLYKELKPDPSDVYDFDRWIRFEMPAQVCNKDIHASGMKIMVVTPVFSEACFRVRPQGYYSVNSRIRWRMSTLTRQINLLPKNLWQTASVWVFLVIVVRDLRLSFQKHRRLIFWAIQFFIWTFYFIFDVEVIHRYAYSAFRSPEMYIYLEPLLFCFFGLPLTLILKAIIDRFFLTYKSTPLFWILGLILPVVMGIGWHFFGQWLNRFFPNHGGFANELVDFFWNVFIASLILLAWSAVYLFIKFWEDWLEQKVKTEQALLLAENARLKMLRYQVNPHFLFNTLSSLRALIRKDPAQAVDMVSRISDFMRYSLGGKIDLFVSLDEEIQATQTYIGIEQIRFGDKLEVLFEVEESTRSLLIPGFILHPIVENAVKYGMETSEMPLKVTIRCRLTDKNLWISVTNTGKWLPEDSHLHGTGTGLRNVRERLSCLYPGTHQFEIEKDPDRVKVIILIENPNHGQEILSADRG